MSTHHHHVSQSLQQACRITAEACTELPEPVETKKDRFSLNAMRLNSSLQHEDTEKDGFKCHSKVTRATASSLGLVAVSWSTEHLEPHAARRCLAYRPPTLRCYWCPPTSHCGSSWQVPLSHSPPFALVSCNTQHFK